MLFWICDSMKNLLRYRKRYIPIVILMLGCAFLSGYFLTSAAAARGYLDAYPFDTLTDPAVEAMRPYILKLDSKSSITSAGVLLVFSAAIVYSSSAAVGERISVMKILYSLGISGKKIFSGMLFEIAVLACSAELTGYLIGKYAAVLHLTSQVSGGKLPEELLDYTSGAGQDILWFVFSIILLLIPMAVFAWKILDSDRK